MNNERDLIQRRYHLGQIEHRQRLTRISDDGETLIVLAQWGPWERPEQVKGDETDARFE